MTLLKFVLTHALGSQTEPLLMGEVEPIMQRRADCQQILGQYLLCVLSACPPPQTQPTHSSSPGCSLSLLRKYSPADHFIFQMILSVKLCYFIDLLETIVVNSPFLQSGRFWKETRHILFFFFVNSMCQFIIFTLKYVWFLDHAINSHNICTCGFISHIKT